MGMSAWATPQGLEGSDPARCLIVPGFAGSGPDHWQTLWERGRSDCRRVELGDWHDPSPERWVAALDAAVRATAGRPVLVAHSLGVLAVAWWAGGIGRRNAHRIGGALLVAPPDVDRADADARLHRFAPTPDAALPFPAIVVASRDDPHATMARSRAMAGAWRAVFVDAGLSGHINARSELGNWLIGQRLLDRLIDGARAGPERPAMPVPPRPAVQERPSR